MHTLIRIGALAALLANAGCGAAHQKLLGHPLAPRQRVAILVSISEQVNAADDDGAVSTLADTVSAKLREHGIESQVYASKEDHPPPPRIELNVLYWHGTRANSSQNAPAVAPVAPAADLHVRRTVGNHIIVECVVVLSDGAPAVNVGRFERSGTIPLFLSSTEDTSSASDAGEAIVDKIMTK